jgi:hypothetical protein
MKVRKESVTKGSGKTKKELWELQVGSKSQLSLKEPDGEEAQRNRWSATTFGPVGEQCSTAPQSSSMCFLVLFVFVMV